MTKRTAKTCVMIKFDQDELAMTLEILDRFFEQNENVFQSAGVRTKKLRTKLKKFYERVDAKFWETYFNGDYSFREMLGEPLETVK